MCFHLYILEQMKFMFIDVLTVDKLLLTGKQLIVKTLCYHHH